MKNVIQFIFDNWLLLGPVIYEIASRLWPTRWNVSILDNLWKIINKLIPNKRVPDGNESGLGTDPRGRVVNKITVKMGKHILRALLIVCLFSVVAEAQKSYNMRQLRFRTGVQVASDTAETSANAGNVWYDFATQRYRANFNGTNGFFGEPGSGSTYSASNGVQLSGSTFTLGGNVLSDRTITIGDLTAPSAGTLTFHGWGFDLLKFTKSGSSANAQFGSSLTTFLKSSPGASMELGGTWGIINYLADRSADYTARSVVDKAYADTKLAGTQTTSAVTFTTFGELSFATFTPTATAGNNVGSIIANQAQYQRAGNVVTVSGGVNVTPSATGNTDFYLSLPFATTVGDTRSVAGTFAGAVNGAAGASDFGYISANSIEDKPIFKFTATSTSQINFWYTYTYVIE